MDRTTRSPAPPATAQLRALANATSDGILTIDAASTVRFANPAVERILGYSPDELEGEPLSTVMSPGLADRHRDGLADYLETGERNLDWTDVRLPGKRKDGSEVPLSISFTEFTADGERFFTGILRDVSDRERQERRLSELHRFAQSLTAVETADGVCHLAMATANNVLPNLHTTAYLYDADAGRLSPVSHTPDVPQIASDTGALFGGDQSVLWDVYQSQERLACADTRTDEAVADAETPLRSLIAVPIGPYGVVASGATTPDAFDRDDVRVLSLLAADVETALDRVEREADLRDRAAELEDHVATLERLNRVNDVIRDLTTALVRAESREELEQAVCTELVNVDPYRFAWIGTPAATGGELRPRASAGVERGYLDAVATAGADGPAGSGPPGRAAATRELQVHNDLATNPPFEPWRKEALQRGYRACISVPLVYRDLLYGVLTLYAGEANAFDDLEVDVLDELGQMVAYATNAVERSAALASDSTVELRFEIADPDLVVAEFARETESSVRLESLVERDDGSLRAFFVVDGASVSEVAEFAARSAAVSDPTHVSETDEGHLFEATVGTETFLARLLDYGAYPTELTATPTGASLTVELPQGGDTQPFLRMMLDTHDGVELVARRELDRPIQSDAEFRAHYADRLTDREEEVLRTAFYAGFFESPRRSSGSEVAELLDVSQPTVNRHLRSGERKLLEMVFENRDGE
ncbi:bacterio-opsin activator domain-containing protein [Halorussus sp. AFM4]|uniref:bacterio-opsin activator domain-containing protein n=1 Tax=Halorussus sp. AFM4 TaxID=3421651 RepID=UPI003EB7C21A